MHDPEITLTGDYPTPIKKAPFKVVKVAKQEEKVNLKRKHASVKPKAASSRQYLDLRHDSNQYLVS
jgi:hypothetical protein